MEQSRSLDAKSSWYSQEITRILWEPGVHYRGQNSPPLVSASTQMNPVVPSILLLTVNINFYARITLPSAYVAAQWVEALCYKSEGRRFDS